MSGGCIDCVYVKVFEPVQVPPAPVKACPIVFVGCVPETVPLLFDATAVLVELLNPFCWRGGETGEFAAKNMEYY